MATPFPPNFTIPSPSSDFSTVSGQMYNESIKTATFHDPVISSHLISLYTHSKTNTLDHVRSVFNQIQQPTLFSWNTLIKSYVENQRSQESLIIFIEFMSRSGLIPDVFTLPCVIKACGKLMAVKEGEQIHGLGLKFGFGTKLVSWNSLMDGYVKFGNIELAKELFDEMTERDVVSWTIMIDGLSKSGKIEDARKVFDEMPSRNLPSWNAMINGYMKAGDFVSARGLFNQMEDKDIITFNSMIAGYELNGQFSEALKLFIELLNLGYTPTDSTLVSTLSVISWLAVLSKGTVEKSEEGEGMVKLGGKGVAMGLGLGFWKMKMDD